MLSKCLQRITERMDWMHRVITHAMVLFCLFPHDRFAFKRHRRIYLSAPADWNHKGRRADKPKRSCQSERFDVTSKHRSHRSCSRSASAACGGPWSCWSCWVSSPQVVPRNSENPELFHATGFTSRVWFQASPIPPAGAAAASPRSWSISRWCPSLRREAATRWSTCLSWSTRPSLWWVPRTIPTVPSGLLKFQANMYFLLLHLSIHVVFVFCFFFFFYRTPRISSSSVACMLHS